MKGRRKALPRVSHQPASRLNLQLPDNRDVRLIITLMSRKHTTVTTNEALQPHRDLLSSSWTVEYGPLLVLQQDNTPKLNTSFFFLSAT